MSKKSGLTVAEMASMGGKARAKKLSPKRRQEIARKAVQERWKRQREKEDRI